MFVTHVKFAVLRRVAVLAFRVKQSGRFLSLTSSALLLASELVQECDQIGR